VRVIGWLLSVCIVELRSCGVVGRYQRTSSNMPAIPLLSLAVVEKRLLSLAVVEKTIENLGCC
jgi:hypothetical protein